MGWQRMFLFSVMLCILSIIALTQLLRIKRRHEFVKQCSQYGESDKCEQLFESYP